MPKFSTTVFVLAIFMAAASGPAQTAFELDVGTLQAGLNTADPNEVAYLEFVVALVNEGSLPRDLVRSTFDWARRKPTFHKRFQYFKFALITLAAEQGIRLPQGNPDASPAINGRVIVRVLFTDVPAPNVTVTIRGSKRTTVTDDQGNFSFPNVPFGRFTLDASGIAAFLPRKGSAVVTLPVTSGGAAFVEIRLK